MIISQGQYTLTQQKACNGYIVCRVEIYANFCKDLQILHYANAL